MKKKDLIKYLFVLIALSGVVLTGCEEEDPPDDPEINYFQEMKTYMEGNGMDLSDVAAEWTTTATTVYDAGTENYYIIDLRSSEDFDTAHIEDAHNTALADVVSEASNSENPILLVCYTGQTAAHAHTALRLSGYSDCKVLKFGMSSWNSNYDSWSANTGNDATGHPNWSATNNIQTPVSFSYPEFTATAETGADILAERVEYMLGEGFKGVDSDDVLASPTSYFINNYWTSADVDEYGHIDGAYRIKEDLTFAAGGFENLDPSSQVVTYCWTGQTSSLITAYLTVLGYDAISLKFGANGMIYDALQVNKWTTDASNDYPVETSE